MGLLLALCGLTAVAIGGWRSYAVAREAVAPLVHPGDQTRSRVEATQPLPLRPRAGLFARRVAFSVGWLLVAMYGLFLVAAAETTR
jgi:hypothetical protein